MGFESTISAGERPQTYAFDRAATGTGYYYYYYYYYLIIVPILVIVNYGIGVYRVSYNKQLQICNLLFMHFVNLLYVKL